MKLSLCSDEVAKRVNTAFLNGVPKWFPGSGYGKNNLSFKE